MAANSEVSLLYVSATSPDGLVQACFINNQKKGKYINYHSITYANGKWFAWYHDEVNPFDILNNKKKK